MTFLADNTLFAHPYNPNYSYAEPHLYGDIDGHRKNIIFFGLLRSPLHPLALSIAAGQIYRLCYSKFFENIDDILRAKLVSLHRDYSYRYLESQKTDFAEDFTPDFPLVLNFEKGTIENHKVLIDLVRKASARHPNFTKKAQDLGLIKACNEMEKIEEVLKENCKSSGIDVPPVITRMIPISTKLEIPIITKFDRDGARSEYGYKYVDTPLFLAEIYLPVRDIFLNKFLVFTPEEKGNGFAGRYGDYVNKTVHLGGYGIVIGLNKERNKVMMYRSPWCQRISSWSYGIATDMNPEGFPLIDWLTNQAAVKIGYNPLFSADSKRGILLFNGKITSTTRKDILKKIMDKVKV